MNAAPALPFEPQSPEDFRTLVSSLNTAQRRQLEAALSYHALLQPGAVLRVNVTVGEITQIPALTDASTLPGGNAGGATVLAEVFVLSTSTGSQAAADEVARTVRLAHPDASPATTRPPEQFSIPRRVYRELEKRGPVLLDDVREFLMKRREHRSSEPIVRYSTDPEHSVLTRAFEEWGKTPSASPAGAAPAVLIGMHWLQTGGAERWAVESVQIAKDAGYLPIVITDQNSVHPWLDRPELEGCVVITLSFNHHEHQIDVAFAHALLENFNVKGIVLHHSQYLYQMLPWITLHRPDVRVMDSLHIVEYLAGGYPGISVHFDEYIDTHHVISPQLVEWLSAVQGVEEHKIALAPLTALTVDSAGAFAPRDTSKPITVAFIGRLSRQKRPDVFLGLVRKLRQQGTPFRAILHGDGEMRGIVDGLIAQFGLSGLIEQRLEDTPVGTTLAESDVLVVTSINEGITLTTFEAIAAGIPVISTDVGSQRTIVDGGELLPRQARPFIKQAAQLIAQYDASDATREIAWNAQLARVTEFSALPSAHDWMKELFKSWQV